MKLSSAMAAPSGKLWPEANKMAALDEYAAQCKLKLPPG